VHTRNVVIQPVLIFLIRGEKTYLRPVEVDDADVIMTWENEPEFWQYTAVPGPFTRETIIEFITSAGSLQKSGQIRYVIFTEDEGPVGALDLFEFDVHQKSAGIGIMIAEKENRLKGYAHDALSATISYLKGTDELAEVRCLIYTDNIPSISLFLKNGFEMRGRKLFKGREAIQFIRHLS
jgi:diamine N-acetyltransferase